MEKTYKEIVDDIIKLLENARIAVFATAANSGHVDIAQMCIVNNNLTVYMQTDKKFEKVNNINENPHVAFNIGAYSFKGLAHIIGHPTSNTIFIEKFKVKHFRSFESYTNLPDEVLIRIDLTQAKIWGIDNDEPIDKQETLTVIDFLMQQVNFIKCDKI